MQAKVKSIDIAQNVGTLTTNSGEELSFSLDDCVGFDDVPTPNELVSYGINNGEIYFVEPSSSEVESSQEVFEEHTTDEVSIAPIRQKKQKFSANISLDISISEAISNYFSDVSYSIEDYNAWFEDFEELDYSLMKRFLLTAYNNLVDMDSGFMDDELLELHSDLQALDKIFTKLKKKDAAPKIAFENIFLDKQKDYVQSKKHLESNSSEIFTLESSMKRLESQIRKIEELLDQGLYYQNTFIEKENELKRLKTYYVDTLHKVATLKEENIALKEALVRFATKYEDGFLEAYEKESKEYFSEIKRLLDGYAYVFDKKMWERAENSSAIITFFKKAHIEDEFSSKTFLKYFLKTLDETKMSKEMRKLEDLLLYLESRAKMRFVIIEEFIADVDKLKHAIRTLDKDFTVESIDKPRSVYYRKDLKMIDFIFVDSSIKNPPVSEFLSMLKVRLKQTKSKAVISLLSSNVTKELILLAKKFNLSSIISLHVKEEELQEDLVEMIQSIEEQ